MDDSYPRSDAPLDLAIIGAGVAGTYVAYRLATRRKDWRIGVFERSERIGGRLLSLPPPAEGGVAAEMGGMRYRTSQPLVSGIIEELGLASRPFLTVHDDNRFFLRGTRWRAAEPYEATGAYALDDSERGLSPAEVLLTAFERIVPGAASLSDDGWVTVKREYRFLGRPLIEWPMEEALQSVLSEDGFRYVVDGFGYTTLFTQRNTADAIPWVLIEARPESENRTLKEGMEQLPRQLAARSAQGGTPTLLEHELTGLDTADDGFALHFAGRPDVLARRVVLAVPRVGLEGVAHRTPVLNGPETAALIRSVTPYPAAKLSLVYERGWWRDAGVEGMRAVTDLPLSKTYYFDRGEGAGQGLALLLASYSDGSNRESWAALRGDARPPRDTYSFDSERRWNAYAASSEQIAEAQRQLRLLHDVERIPDPVASAFVDWRIDGSGAAWHCWNPGARSWKVVQQIVQPLPEHEIYVCGEAYSWSQGWVEGALESADRVVDILTGTR